MKFRIFYAPQCFDTFEKIFVLTDDGKLYCEYLMFGNKTKIIRDNIEYNNFDPKDLKWGKGIVGNKGVAYTNYQVCNKELSYDDYKNLQPSEYLSQYKNWISSQIGWIENYLDNIGLNKDNWDSLYLSKKN
jgi:hypothetical protein